MAFRGGFSILIVQILILSLVGFSESQLTGFDLCSCSMRYEPVCGSDGITYKNLCFLQCERSLHKSELKSISNGACLSGKKTDRKIEETELVGSIDVCSCSDRFEPVCGSDGKTYKNECLLMCAKLFLDHTLWKTSDGECNTASQMVTDTNQQNLQAEYVCNCTTKSFPVCGYDGKGYALYRNKCLLQCAKIFYPKLQIVETDNCRIDLTKSLETINDLQAADVCNCSTKYHPVCGYNDNFHILFRNRCVFLCVKLIYPKIRIVDIGRCKIDQSSALENRMQDDDHCFCTSKLQPICGSDGMKYITYQNYCVFQCMKLKYPRLRVVHNGECISKLTKAPDRKKPRDLCKCSAIFNQVCGTDGVTYRNMCVLQCTKLYYKYDLLVDHSGHCEYMKERTVLQDIEYDPPPVLGCVCPSEVVPVCGSDGTSYRNMCWFQCQKTHYNHILWLVYVGKCRGSKLSTPLQIEQVGYSCNCSTSYDPVCGSDGRTYLNQCYFGCQLFFTPEMWILHGGECFFTHRPDSVLLPTAEAEYLCNCSRTYDPVCGSDGRSYINNCYLKCIQFYDRNLWKIHNGKCTIHDMINEDTLLHRNTQEKKVLGFDWPCGCPDIYDPICGSDGVTYTSPCHLECAHNISSNMCHKTIWKIYDGECKEPPTPENGAIVSYGDSAPIVGMKWPCNCPNTNEPLCGSDGITYKNPCHLESANFFCDNIVHKSYDGKCRDSTTLNSVANPSFRDSVPIDPLCICPKICQPVCGSDGMTYVNQCQLDCKRRKGKRDVFKLYDGYCPNI